MEIAFRFFVHSVKRLNKVSIIKRGIMTSSSKAQKYMEEMEKTNPYYEKYAKKIADLQKTSPEEFMSRLEAQEKQTEKKKEPIKEKNFSSLLQPKKTLETPAKSEQESLDSIMKVDLVKDKSVDEIKEIWLKHHLQKDVLAAIIPVSVYEKIIEQSKETPLFIFPLPRSQGYEFIMSQFQNNSIHFTPLICYQVHKENAPECLTIKNFTEFKDDKGIVLMRGEYDKNVLDPKEAQCLANQFQLYYNQEDPEKLEIMKLFNREPDKFKHMDLIRQIENLKL